MNWILIVTSIIFLVCIGVGVYRGAVRIAVSLAATIVTLLLVFFLTPLVGKAICSFTPLDETIEQQVTKAITKAVETKLTGGTQQSGLTEENVRMAMSAAGISEEALEMAGITVEGIVNGEVSGEQLEQFGVSSSLFDGLKSGDVQISDDILNTEIPRDTQISAIEGADLPEVFKTLLLTNNNGEIYKELGVETFAQYVAKYLAKLIVNIIAFLLTFIIITLILRAVIYALDIVTSLPVLGWINRLAGALTGAAGALVIVWFGFIVVTLLFTTNIGKDLMVMINENSMLKFLYEHNYIMNLATNLR